MNPRDRIIARIAETHGAETALVLVARLLDTKSLNEVAADLHIDSAARVRQIEASAIRTLSVHQFDVLTVAIQDVRPGFAWHPSVYRQRSRDWIPVA